MDKNRLHATVYKDEVIYYYIIHRHRARGEEVRAPFFYDNFSH